MEVGIGAEGSLVNEWWKLGTYRWNDRIGMMGQCVGWPAARRVG